MRTLRFQTLTEAAAELDRIEKAVSVHATGLWSYPQILDHLADAFESSISTYPSLVPAFIRKTLGKLIYTRMVNNGFMSSGSPNPSAPKVRKEGDARISMKRLRKAMSRFESHKGEMAVHPMFDVLSKEQFAHLHAMHMANHLGFVETRDAADSRGKRKPVGAEKKAAKKSSRKSVKTSAKKTAKAARKPARKR